jgi:hypothetical protein
VVQNQQPQDVLEFLMNGPLRRAKFQQKAQPKELHEKSTRLGGLLRFWPKIEGKAKPNKTWDASSDLSSVAVADSGRRSMLRACIEREPSYGEWVKSRPINLGSSMFCLEHKLKASTSDSSCQLST